MEELTDLLKTLITDSVEKLYGHRPETVFLEHPADKKWGDYATNICMGMAKEFKQNPMEIAKKLCYELQQQVLHTPDTATSGPFWDKIEVAPPGFINFTLAKKWLYSVLFDVHAQGDGYGSRDLGKHKRIALEHSNVNPNKAAHIGHLRNACIGQFIEKVYEFLGYDVEVQYYANNLGVQVATSVMGVERITALKGDTYAKYDHYAWDVYSKMEGLISNDEALKKERESLMVKLEDPASPESVSQKTLARKILKEQLKTFQNLNFDYDVIIFESDVLYMNFWKTAFEQLKKNENVYFATEGASKGCWLVKVSSGKMTKKSASEEAGVEEDKIIVRSNGVPTYTGKDISYHMWKFGLLNEDFGYEHLNYQTQEKTLWGTTSFPEKTPVVNGKKVTFSSVDKVINVIGGEQTYAMAVVKQALEFLGYQSQADNMIHVNYGFVYLSPKTAQELGIDISDGKEKYGMSGRKGWGVKIDDFIDMVDAKLRAEHGDFNALRDVRNGAIKFEMLKYNTFQDLIFDLEGALSIKGYSGPYVQYTFARANSVLEKAPQSINTGKNIVPVDLKEVEMMLLRSIYLFPEIVERSASEFAPNILCTYLFELAQTYNNFYNEASILNAESESLVQFRLAITRAVWQILKNGLQLLGIEAPSKM